MNGSLQDMENTMLLRKNTADAGYYLCKTNVLYPMFTQRPKSTAKTNLSHLKQFYKQITDSNIKLLCPC